MANDLQDYASISARGTPDTVKDWIDDRVHGGLSKIYRGALQVAASGFGKGLLVGLAVATVAAVAIGIGFATGGLAYTAPTVALGVQAGVNTVATFLLSGSGLIALASAGAVGAVAETISERGKITAKVAKDQAEIYRLMREKDSAPAVAPAVDVAPAPDKLAESCSHCAQLAMRRQQEALTAQRGA